MDKLKSFVSQIGDRARYDVLNVTPGPSSPTVEHQEAEGFLCPICHQAFSVPEQLQRHFDDMHEEDPGSSNGDIASLRHEVKGLTLSLQEERDLLKAEVERLSKQNEVLMKQGGDFLKLQEKTRQETLPLHVSLKEAVEEAALLRAAKQEVELKAVELAKRNADLSAKVDLLESQITERHQVNVGSESELKKEVERLETDMMTREAEFERAKVRWEVQLRDALEQKTEEFSQRREEELGTAREEMQKILEQKDAEVEKIRRDKDAEIKRLEEGNSSRQNDLKELREAHDSNLKQQQKMFEEKIETISKQLAAKEEEKRDAVETLKERFQKERSSAQMQIAKSQQLLSQVQADLKSQLEERAAKIDKLTRDLEERTLALERSNKDLASTSSRVQLLEKEKEELVKKIEIGEGDMTLVHQLQTEIKDDVPVSSTGPLSLKRSKLAEPSGGPPSHLPFSTSSLLFAQTPTSQSSTTPSLSPYLLDPLTAAAMLYSLPPPPWPTRPFPGLLPPAWPPPHHSVFRHPSSEHFSPKDLRKGSSTSTSSTRSSTPGSSKDRLPSYRLPSSSGRQRSSLPSSTATVIAPSGSPSPPPQAHASPRDRPSSQPPALTPLKHKKQGDPTDVSLIYDMSRLIQYASEVRNSGEERRGAESWAQTEAS
ncbi:unnamed protein product [Cyprideis torosa]|uniref:Uncharacterized protein n=1 Tax=Cyprideis torosa TaxID=163714 RepID=A0A7R8ZNJ0_9CRUS|nr:unnamed protein product [Cyprideis torosa]CAG0887903.1 unnamed protein product [Cyprideis torosa]